MLTTTDVSDIPSIPSISSAPLAPQPTAPCCSNLKSRKVVIGVLAGLIILILISAAAFGAYQLGKNQVTSPTSTIATPSAPPATPSINPIVEPASDPTANWKTYPFLTGSRTQPLLGITYKLPSGSEPIWIDTARSYQSAGLVRNTKIAMIPSGPGMPLQNSWEGFQEMSGFSRLAPKQTTVSGKQALDISGTFASQYVNPSALGFIGKPAGRFRAVVIKASDTISIEILHYQEANRIQVIGAEPDFDADEVLFDQILSTFKFLDQSTVSPNTYLACGCGCCGGSTPQNVCLYKSKGDNLEKIIQDDLTAKASPDCAVSGCSLGTSYKYCD